MIKVLAEDFKQKQKKELKAEKILICYLCKNKINKGKDFSRLGDRRIICKKCLKNIVEFLEILPNLFKVLLNF